MRGSEYGFVPEEYSQKALEKTETKNLNYEKAIKAMGDEKTLLERFRSKAQDVVRVLLLVTALNFSPLLHREAYGAEGEEQKKEQKEETKQQDRAIKILRDLYTLPDNSRATSPGQNIGLKQEAAKILIQAYALERKGITEGHVSPQDMKETLEELNGVTGLFADSVLSDNDGKIEFKDLQKFREAIKSNPGLQAFMELYMQYQQVE